MADWIFQGNEPHYDLQAAVARSRQQWWSTSRYRHQIAIGDRVWLQFVGRDHPGIYYVAAVTSQTYEDTTQPHETSYGRWRTDIRFDYSIDPPLLRSELLADPELGGFRPFHGFQGSAFPVPEDVAQALTSRAEPRLVALEPSPQQK